MRNADSEKENNIQNQYRGIYFEDMERKRERSYNYNYKNVSLLLGIAQQ